MVDLVRRRLQTLIPHGNLTIDLPGGRSFHAGDGSGEAVRLRIDRPMTLARMLVLPSRGFADAYSRGAVELVEGDLGALTAMAHSTTPRRRGPLARLASRLRQINTPRRAGANARHHYDLPEAFYRLFLDDDMQYSCAYFPRPGIALDEAQLAKKRHIAAKLALKPGLSVLDIGSGWGGLALYLARHAQCRVQGLTASPNQFRVSAARAHDAALERDVRFVLGDYRAIEGPFDRIVSVGMFEHVGLNHYRTFFRAAARLLGENGVMLLHTIGRMGPPQPTDAFIRRDIFPGGYLPALSEIAPAIEAAGLIVTDLEVLRLHYAETLKAWRERFNANRLRAAAMVGEPFCRKWDLYLAGSEAAFRHGDLAVFQIQLAHRRDAAPIVRDYIAAAEAELEGRDAARPRLARPSARRASR